MVSRRLATKAGVIAGVGAVSAFGVVTPAQAYTCDITIDPTEDALRAAIADGDVTICINPGTLHMGNGGSASDNIPVVIDSDLTIVGLGDVVVDGDNETAGFIVGANATDIDLVIDNLTISNFRDWDYDGRDSALNEEYVPVVGFNRSASGNITVLNSVFNSNSSYVGIVAAVDQDNFWGSGAIFGTITLDNTVFENNYSDWGVIWGYATTTVTNSTFHSNTAYNASVVEQWSAEDLWNDSSALVSGNFFSENTTYESEVYLDSHMSSIYNNTFAWNHSTSDWSGSAIATTESATSVIAYNTFHENNSDFDTGSVSVGSGMDVTLTGNVFSNLDGEPGITAEPETTHDRGGNVSTADDSAILDANTSLNLVGEEDLVLEEPADNGGPTWTMALGAGSVARDLMESSVVANELGPDLAVDQRGVTRDALVDSGAWDSGAPEELASTGADASGIALTGGALAVAGVAIAARRRRTS